MSAPLRIGVLPAAAAACRPRLLAALELAYPIAFEGRAEGEWSELDAVLAFGPEGLAAVERDAPGVPVLALLGEEAAVAGEPVALELADDELLARPLRGTRLTDAHGSQAVGGGDVLATAVDRPVWVRRSDALEVAALAPAELDEDEALRDRLYPGRTLALLPLAQFLARLTAATRWQPAPPHAAIILDDPNLHWPSYGRVNYAAMADHAREHRYHVSLATVPLDAWLVNPRVARLFAESAAELSLCVHGNDHQGPELGRPQSDVEGVALASEALRRIQRFERRSGVPVARVMVPPHERVSEPAARALTTCGYDALCTTRPYPWMVSKLRAPWLTRPDGASPLAGWETTDVVANGLPVLLRSAFFHPREDLVLRAFLGQPLILYGHHDDLDAGMDVLAEAAADVNRLGDVRWRSLADMAAASVETRRDADTLHVRPRARRTRVEVPAGVSRLELDLSILGLPDATPVRADGTTIEGTSLAVAGPGTIELDAHLPAPAAGSTTAIHRRVWPFARRIASEGRDRVDGVKARTRVAAR